jgi:hypothetical protein
MGTFDRAEYEQVLKRRSPLSFSDIRISARRVLPGGYAVR